MAKEGYWEEQFVQALPVFLANWFADNYITAIVESCEREGVESLLKATGGLYKTDMIGLWISNHTNAVNIVLDHLKTDDPIHKALFSKITYSHIVSRTKSGAMTYSFDEYPDQLLDALYRALGKKIQKTTWWKNHIKAIKRGSRHILAVKKVMEC